MKRGPWYGLVLLLICGAIASGGNIAYTNRIDRESDRENEKNDRKWCALLILMDDAYRSGTPPTTEVGRRIAAAIHELRTSLGC
jgi:hypothetical protein